jgi:hypothetical protein
MCYLELKVRRLPDPAGNEERGPGKGLAKGSGSGYGSGGLLGSVRGVVPIGEPAGRYSVSEVPPQPLAYPRLTTTLELQRTS